MSRVETVPWCPEFELAGLQGDRQWQGSYSLQASCSRPVIETVDLAAHWRMDRQFDNVIGALDDPAAIFASLDVLCTCVPP